MEKKVNDIKSKNLKDKPRKSFNGSGKSFRISKVLQSTSVKDRCEETCKIYATQLSEVVQQDQSDPSPTSSELLSGVFSVRCKIRDPGPL